MGSISTKLIILPPPSPSIPPILPETPPTTRFWVALPSATPYSVHELAEEQSLFDQQLVWLNVHGLLVAQMNTQRPVLGLQWSSHGFTLPFVLREGEVGEGRRGRAGKQTSPVVHQQDYVLGKCLGGKKLRSKHAGFPLGQNQTIQLPATVNNSSPSED